MEAFDYKIDKATEMLYYRGNLCIYKNFFDEKDRFVSNDEDSLFYRVPKRIICLIDGCPSRMTEVEIDFNEDSERVVLCAS